MAQIDVFVKPNGATMQEIEPQVYSLVDYICASCAHRSSAPRAISKSACEIAAIPSMDILSGNLPVGANVGIRCVILRDENEEK